MRIALGMSFLGLIYDVKWLRGSGSDECIHNPTKMDCDIEYFVVKFSYLVLLLKVL
jgi:hypothetical protein